MDKRPDLNEKISVEDFKDFYWLKKELTDFCKKVGLSQRGSKIEAAKRIEYFLNTGEKLIPTKKTSSPKSKFDWKNEKLTLKTQITDNYKNSENVRTFFEQQIGKKFRFNVKFMNWMKTNSGKTLEDAIKKWNEIENQKKNNTNKKEIEPQFEYNTYLRDFLADNPDKKRATGVKLWNIKRTLRGDNIYKKTDLNLLSDDD